ncbi:unnamed protein product [Cladocopium goreaui]|uniref:Dapdiamide A synthase (ATP-dependen t N-fumaramoyl-DAP-amino acid ligase) n=1 Tax=Cladocopium goreaui TaxID=2562237 RepID=A0A9P1BTK4_9DINO|nr:unnamed protein product [Cladocopium goreaui]
MLQRRRVSKIPEPDLLKVVEAGLTVGSLVGSCWILDWALGTRRRAAVEADAKVMREKRLRRATRRPEESLEDLLIKSRDQAEALDYAAGGDSDEVQVAFETFHRAVADPVEARCGKHLKRRQLQRQIQADPVSRFFRGEAEGLEITSLLCAGPPTGPALPVVVLTDPISTGALLVDIVLSSGFGVLVLWSKERAESLPISHKGVYKAVKEQVSIPETVKAIKGALSPGSAIIACIPGSESGVNLADLISIWLGLLANGSGNRPFPAGDRRNKHLQSSVLKGIAGCRAIREVCGCAWEEVRDSCRELGLPMVVKPVQSAGTDGVKLCYSMKAVEEHFRHLQATQRRFASSDHAILLQEFMVGQEYVVDQVSRDGVHKTIMTWVYEKQPANGSDFVYLAMRPVESKDCPSDLIPYTRSVLDALDIQNGATHTEVMMTADGPCLIEVNVRVMGGNGSFISLARLLTGTSHADAVLDCIDQKRFDALPDVPRAFQASGLVVFLISYSSGIVASTPGYEVMKKMDSFLELHTSISPGSAVEVTVDTFTFAGILVLAGSEDQIWADIVEVRRLEKEGLFCFTETNRFQCGGA